MYHRVAILIVLMGLIIPEIGAAEACGPGGCVPSYWGVGMEVSFSADPAVHTQQTTLWYSNIKNLALPNCKVTFARPVPFYSANDLAELALLKNQLETNTLKPFSSISPDLPMAGVDVTSGDDTAVSLCVERLEKEALNINPQAEIGIINSGTL